MVEPELEVWASLFSLLSCRMSRSTGHLVSVRLHIQDRTRLFPQVPVCKSGAFLVLTAAVAGRIRRRRMYVSAVVLLRVWRFFPVGFALFE